MLSRSLFRGNLRLIILLTSILLVHHTDVASLASPEIKKSLHSKLQGRWEIKLSDFAHALGCQDPFEVNESALNASITIAAINEDGTFDWTRSWDGIAHGWRRLGQSGGQCANPKNPIEDYLVASSEYTETSSKITILLKGPAQQTQQRTRIEGTLLPNDQLRLSVNNGTPDGRESGREFLLNRSNSEQDCGIAETSQLAGEWVIAPTESSAGVQEILLAFREDGTFDWSATQEGEMWGWNRLCCKGDSSVCVLPNYATFRVINGEYTKKTSHIQIEFSWAKKANLTPRNAKMTAQLRQENELDVQIEWPNLNAVGSIKKTLTLVPRNYNKLARRVSMQAKLN